MTSSNDTAHALIDSFITDFNGHPDLPAAISSIEEAYFRKINALDSDPSKIYFEKAVALWEKVLEAAPEFFFEDDPDIQH